MNNSNLDLKKFLQDYLRHWKWFVLSIIIALGLAFLNLRYTVPQFQASAKIQIIDDKGASSELSILQDLDVFSGGKTKVKDEIELLKARANSNSSKFDFEKGLHQAYEYLILISGNL